MNKATSLAVVTATLTAAAHAAPMVSIGDNADIFFNLGTAVKVDDNVTGAPANELDDVIFTVSPGLEVDFFRGETLWDAVFQISTDFVRYSDNDQYDVNNLNVSFGADYASPVLEASFGASYSEDQQKTQQVVGDLVEIENTVIQGFVKYDVTEKVAVSFAPRYTLQEYVEDFDSILPDRDRILLSLKGYYAISPKYDITAGIAYRETDIDDLPTRVGADPEDIRLTVGVEGEVLPKVTAALDVGYTERSFSGIDRSDQSILYLGGDLTWAATPKISVNLALSQDFQSTATGNPIESSSATLNVTYEVNEMWAVAPFLKFLTDDYVGGVREDDVAMAGVGVGYSPNGFLNFGAQVYYLENDSTLDLDYDNTVFELTASLRY
ncbi:MAG: outer membrane beta-barrel protein [Verrucomicrobiota bacterium]